MSQYALDILSLLTLASNIFLIIFFLVFLFRGTEKRVGQIWKKLLKLLKIHSINFALIISLTSTLGSLFFSEIAQFEPCKLCWFQRIFMYPLVFILAVAIFRKTKDVVSYVLPLSFVGAAFALYHYYLQINPSPLAPCSTIGFSVSCSDRFTTSFGYITIPWMSFSAFLLITLLMLLNRARSLVNER